MQPRHAYRPSAAGRRRSMVAYCARYMLAAAAADGDALRPQAWVKILALLAHVVVASCASRAAANFECAVVDVSETVASLHHAQRMARRAAAAAKAPCVTVLLGNRTFRLAEEPLVLSAEDSHTSWEGGEITTAIDVPGSAWQAAAAVDDSGSSTLDITDLVTRSEWGAVSGANGIVPGSHLSLLLRVGGIWRPMTVARWPNVPFNFGETPPVNWTTISKTCPCGGSSTGGGCNADNPPSKCGLNCKSFTWADDTDRPARWVQAANEGRLFIHGFFKYMWKDYFATITEVDVATRQLTANTSIGGTYGITNDSFYYAYGMHEELDNAGEYILNETSGKL
eukprot:COSAG05_NODE_5916_length_1060_cov_1.047867_1_plen_338_part_01